MGLKNKIKMTTTDIEERVLEAAGSLPAARELEMKMRSTYALKSDRVLEHRLIRLDKQSGLREYESIARDMGVVARFYTALEEEIETTYQGVISSLKKRLRTCYVLDFLRDGAMELAFLAPIAAFFMAAYVTDGAKLPTWTMGAVIGSIFPPIFSYFGLNALADRVEEGHKTGISATPVNIDSLEYGLREAKKSCKKHDSHAIDRLLHRRIEIDYASALKSAVELEKKSPGEKYGAFVEGYLQKLEESRLIDAQRASTTGRLTVVQEGYAGGELGLCGGLDIFSTSGAVTLTEEGRIIQ